MPVHFDPFFRDDVFEDKLWNMAMIPLALPTPGRYGALRVVQERAACVPLFGRQLSFATPIVLTRLFEGAILWMSDTPQERLMMLRGASGMEGDVLVAGGGLGVYPQYLQRYTRAKRITVVERHPDVVAVLGSTLDGDTALEIVQAPFEAFIAGVRGRQFDCCYIDIHPTLDPRWLPGLNRLRDRCTSIVRGPIRIWGYAWMARQLARGMERHYLPLLRRGLRFDDQLGDALARDLPANWQQWSQTRLQAWLRAYAHSVTWPAELGDWSQSQDYRPKATPWGV